MTKTNNVPGRGIGRLLMASIEDWSMAQDLRRLELLADRNNKSALDFYESLKWHKTQLICLHRAGFTVEALFLLKKTKRRLFK